MSIIYFILVADGSPDGSPLGSERFYQRSAVFPFNVKRTFCSSPLQTKLSSQGVGRIEG